MKRILIFITMLLNVHYVHADIGVVKTNSGQISGSLSDDKSVHIFKGIPFAAPPIGDLRWKAPQPVKPWQGIKQTTAFAPSPMQAIPNEFGVYTREFLIKDEPLSEDCLYLNVWTAAKSAIEKRPVIVWIYGGGYVSGGTNVPIYDGEALAKKGVILVSIAYRVGIFGFFSHPELTRESPNHTSGNYGLMDQAAALTWVQNNIAAFGGDPKNVTIAGQSAGAFSVNYLVASPHTKGLFAKAIAESGASIISTSKNIVSLAQAEQRGFKTADLLQAKTLADLRELSADTLLKQNNFRPIIDGYFLPQSVADIFAANKENQVPLLSGWNEDDAFVDSFQNATDYIAGAKRQYGDKANEFLKFYPANTDAEAERSQIRVSRDITFGGASYRWANVQSAKKKSKVYVYRFARRVPASPPFARYGAFHTAEVGYVFNNLKFLNRPFEPVDQTLADVTSSYWVNFAKAGNPNQDSLPYWPEYEPTTSQIMLLNEKPAATTLPDKAALDFALKEMID
ncbi:MAG: carboxylesterase family protein [Gammaproteobacteria bacterium]|nr:MAG: carboxylesterase family protein [Gammaproteobacteria bacterium]